MTAITSNRLTRSSANEPALYIDFDHLFIRGCRVKGRSEHKLRPINPCFQEVSLNGKSQET